MLINVPCHLSEGIRSRLVLKDDHQKYTLAYYIMLVSSDGFPGVDLSGISSTQLIKKKFRRNLKHKLHLLLSLVIGNDPEKNKNFDQAVFTGVAWAGVLKGNAYQIPSKDIVDKYLKRALRAIISEDDIEMVDFYFQKINQISLQKENSKKKEYLQLFSKVFLDVLSTSKMVDHYSSGIDYKILYFRQIMIYLFNHLTIVDEGSPAQIWIDDKSYYSNTLSNIVSTNDLPTKIDTILKINDLEILYLIREMHFRQGNIDYFNHVLLNSIIRLLFSDTRSVFQIKTSKDSPTRRIMSIIYKHFHDLNSKVGLTRNEFEFHWKNYFGSWSISDFCTNDKKNSNWRFGNISRLFKLKPEEKKDIYQKLLKFQQLYEKIRHGYQEITRSRNLSHRSHKAYYQNMSDYSFPTDMIRTTSENLEVILEHYKTDLKIDQSNKIINGVELEYNPY